MQNIRRRFKQVMMKYFEISNLRSVAITCIGGSERNMMAVLFDILMKIFLVIPNIFENGLGKPPSQNEKYFFESVLLILNKFTGQYDNINLRGISTSLLRTRTLKFL